MSAPTFTALQYVRVHLTGERTVAMTRLEGRLGIVDQVEPENALALVSFDSNTSRWMRFDDLVDATKRDRNEAALADAAE